MNTQTETLLYEFKQESISQLEIALEEIHMLKKQTVLNEDTMNLLNRIVHNLKGSASFLSLKDLEAIAHSSEDLLDELKNTKNKKTNDVIENLVINFEKCITIILGLNDKDTSTNDMSLEDVIILSKKNALSMAMEQNKQVQFDYSGENAIVEPNTIRFLKEIIFHLIRNSVIHGIELPSERKVSGKSSIGLISIKCHQDATNLVVDICDDGRGIDLQRLTEKALSMGKNMEELSQKYLKNDPFQIIFLPGLSTSQETTLMAGRGIGMDIVKKNLIQINGTCEIKSTEGKGTLFKLKIPKAKS